MFSRFVATLSMFAGECASCMYTCGQTLIPRTVYLELGRMILAFGLV